MFIWGNSYKTIGAVPLKGNCSNCNEEELYYITFQKQFTLYYIPTFPLGKSSLIVCQRCSTEYPSINAQLGPQDVPKTPLSSYAGLGIFGTLIGAFVTFMIFEQNNIKELRTHLEVNDTVLFKTLDAEYRKTPYAYFKIIEKNGDTFVIKDAAFAFSHLSDAKKRVQSEGNDVFLEEPSTVTQQDIDDLKIKDIIRPKPGDSASKTQIK